MSLSYLILRFVQNELDQRVQLKCCAHGATPGLSQSRLTFLAVMIDDRFTAELAENAEKISARSACSAEAPALNGGENLHGSPSL